MSEIWVVRHGETEWSASGRHTGRTDVPLTADGVRQAAALCPVLDRHRFALVLSSPMRRATETARIAGFAGRVQLTEDLCEWDYGQYEGLTLAQVRQRDPGWAIWTGRVPGGETADQVAARARQVLARCAETDGDVLLFAHGHVLRVLTAVYLGLGPAEGARFALEPAAIGVLGHEHEHSTLRRWNVPARSL